jgi:hypothetical protein
LVQQHWFPRPGIVVAFLDGELPISRPLARARSSLSSATNLSRETVVASSDLGFESLITFAG